MSDTQNALATTGDTNLMMTSLFGMSEEERKQREQAMIVQASNTGGGGGGGGMLPQTGIRIKLNKDGTLVYDELPDFDPAIARRLKMIIVPEQTNFGLTRWLRQNEVIEGRSADAKGPVCSTINSDIMPGRGYFPSPVWGPAGAAKSVPGLQGSGGHDGKQGVTACATCPLAVAGLDRDKKACKVHGTLQGFVVGKNENMFQDATKAFWGSVELSQANVIAYEKFITTLRKIHPGQPISHFVVDLSVNKNDSGGGGVIWAEAVFTLLGPVPPAVIPHLPEVYKATTTALAARKEAQSGQGPASTPSGASAAAGTPPPSQAAGDAPWNA